MILPITASSDDMLNVIIEFIENPDARVPSQVVDDTDIREQIDDVLASLSPREEKVIRMRFGIGEPTQYSLEEIGSRFALTRERIRQIEIKALRKLRQTKRRNQLEALLSSRHISQGVTYQYVEMRKGDVVFAHKGQKETDLHPS